jgi:hypothetical protein
VFCKILHKPIQFSIFSTGIVPMADQDVRQKRKSLAVDVDTYMLLCEICEKKRRSLIEELRSVIKKEHDKIFDDAYEGVWD